VTQCCLSLLLTVAEKSTITGKGDITYTHTHAHAHAHAHAHTHTFNGPFSATTQVSRYQKGKTNPDFTEARDSEWQWHQLGRMQVCTSLQTDNHASSSTPPLSFLQAVCPSCRPTNSVKALKAGYTNPHTIKSECSQCSSVLCTVQLYGGHTSIRVSLCGFNDTTYHGWHVHTTGSIDNRAALQPAQPVARRT